MYLIHILCSVTIREREWLPSDNAFNALTRRYHDFSLEHEKPCSMLCNAQQQHSRSAFYILLSTQC